MTNADVFVVVPAFNEGGIILQTLAPLNRAGYSVVVVDDGSTVPLSTVLAHEAVHVLRHPVNLGQGAALQTGTEFALRSGAAFVVHFDADGQHSPTDIESLLAVVRRGEADVALGSRFLREADGASVPAVRKVLLKGARIVNGVMTGVWLSDAHNGLRVLNRLAAEHIRITEAGYAHATEILERIRDAHLRLREVPTHVQYTSYSSAKGQPPWNALNIVWELLVRKLLGS